MTKVNINMQDQSQTGVNNTESPNTGIPVPPGGAAQLPTTVSLAVAPVHQVVLTPQEVAAAPQSVAPATQAPLTPQEAARDQQVLQTLQKAATDLQEVVAATTQAALTVYGAEGGEEDSKKAPSAPTSSVPLKEEDYPNDKRGRARLLKLAKQGDMEAQVLLAKFLLIASPKNKKMHAEAIYWLKQAGYRPSGHAGARALLEKFHDLGDENVPEEPWKEYMVSSLREYAKVMTDRLEPGMRERVQKHLVDFLLKFMIDASEEAKAKGYDLATHPEKLWPLSLEGMTVLVGSFVLYERRQAAAENPEAAIA